MSISKKLNYTLIILVTFVLLYIIYRDLIYYENQKDYTFLYLIVCFISFILIIMLNLSNQLRSNIITVIISILFSLYLVEIILFLNLDLKSFITFNKNFDKRTKFEAYLELKEKDSSIQPAIFPTNFISDRVFNNPNLIPFGNISNTNILWCNENGYYVVFKSDKHGFRNNNIIWKNDFINFTFLGDSYVEGACVKTKDTISENLSKISNQNVLNLARGGNGPLLNLAILYEFSKLSKKSKLFWFYYEGNDISDMKKELQNSHLKKYFENSSFSQKLKSRQNEIDNILTNYSEEQIKNLKGQTDHNLDVFSYLKILKISNLRYYLQLLILRNTNNQPRIEKNDLKTFVKIVNKGKKFSLEKEADFYFVYLPSYNRYLTKGNENYLSKKLLLEMIKEQNIKVIDIDMIVFDKLTDKLNLFPLRRSGHYNEKGYKAVSEAIFNYIQNE